MSNVTPIGPAKATTDAVSKDCAQIIALSQIAAIADLVSVVCEYQAIGALQDEDGTVKVAMEMIRDLARGAA